MITLDVFCVSPDVSVPEYGTSLSTCFDLGLYPERKDDGTFSDVSGYDQDNYPVKRIFTNDEIDIYPGDRLLMPTGLVFKITRSASIETFADINTEREELKQFSIRLHARSGMALKRGLVLANSEGVVDVDYQQQVYVLLFNSSKVAQQIKLGERIAQAEVVVNENIAMHKVSVYPTKYSERNGGFGSTGNL